MLSPNHLGICFSGIFKIYNRKNIEINEMAIKIKIILDLVQTKFLEGI